MAAAAAVTAVLAAGCAPAASRPPDLPAVMTTALPPVPEVRGPLTLRVEYPDSLQRIAAADSNFLFGTVGTGDATLIVDGTPVPVEPNGAFLAWLPVPPAGPGDTAVYRLVARRGAEMDTLRHPVLRPPVPPADEWADRLLDPTRLGERPERWSLPDEALAVEVRAAPDAVVEVVAGRTTFALPAGPEPEIRVLVLRAEELYRAACVPEDCNWGPEPDRLRLLVRARRTDGGAAGAASGARRRDEGALVLPLRILDPVRLPVAELREPSDPVHGTDGVVVGRPAPSGPYRWRFPHGTRAEVDGRIGARLRLRLGPALHAWVAVEDAAVLPAGTPAPRAGVGDLRFLTLADRTELAVPLAAPLPLAVERPDARTVDLVLYGAVGLTDRISFGAEPRFVTAAEWTQEAGPAWRLRLRLAAPLWGWRARWERAAGERGGSDGSGGRGGGAATLRLELRGPPPIDPAAPLRGRRIAVDPGHPGAGATGPTGLYEGDANLAVGRILARLLAERGAEPFLVRDDTLPLGLYERTSAAEAAGAELFVSIHANALPDGVRPFGREGTSTYHYHPHAAALADAVQRGMLEEMRLRDLGVFWGDLAVTRMSWMPAVLAEGAFLMMPRHEAALRDPAFQARYARGVLRGIEAFLRAAASGEAP
ncbi:MAG: N-acetylmuramoyl-L-alanine amidase [Gemmatimonadota bacterium]|nr:N-acetylmuramoyl-L-alanine amidase [Gemmatimonadota bacterium]